LPAEEVRYILPVSEESKMEIPATNPVSSQRTPEIAQAVDPLLRCANSRHADMSRLSIFGISDLGNKIHEVERW
jgi:hypothetical protein